jgi:hypothetical protein
MINPVADPVSGIYTTKSAGLSHRYFYAVDTSAEGQWAGKCGYVALTEAPWASSADVLMKTVPFIMHTILLNMHLFWHADTCKSINNKKTTTKKIPLTHNLSLSHIYFK